MTQLTPGPSQFGVMMTLAQLAAASPTPRPSGESVADQAQRILEGIKSTLLNPSLATQGKWQAVWIALSADGANLLYIAAAPAYNAFAVCCRGTQFNSLIDLGEDLEVGEVAQFTSGRVGGPLLVSAGAMKAFTDSTSAPGAPPAPGTVSGTLLAALTQLLSGAPANPTVCVTGHSLGGAMATMIALYLVGETLPNSPSFQVYTFAAPTAGLGTFASVYNSMLPNAFRVYNQYDAVPYAWADLKYVQDNLYPTPSSANPAYPGPAQTLEVTEMLKDLAKAPGPNLYVQTNGNSPTGRNTTVLNSNYGTYDTAAVHATTGDFLAQVGYQHNCYLALLGATPLPAAGQAGGPPVVESIVPNAGPAAGGTPVTITGGTFTTDCEVDFGTVPAVVTNITATSITATQPPGVGTVDVRVTNMYGTSAATPADRFMAPPPLGPTVTSVSPEGGPAGATYPITITGTGFATPGGLPYAVTFGGNAAAVSAMSLTEIAVTPPPSGTGAVSVQVSNKQGKASWAAQFQFGVPLVTGVSPASGVATGGGKVTISGYGFGQGCTVKFGETPATIVSGQPTVIVVTAPPTTVLGAHKIIDVTVTKAGQTSPVTPADQYLYYPKPKED